MKLNVRYFAALREALGTGETLDWAEGEGLATPCVGAFRAWLISRSSLHAELLAAGRAVRVAVDHTIAFDGSLLRDGAEVAFFPPVTGG